MQYYACKLSVLEGGSPHDQEQLDLQLRSDSFIGDEYAYVRYLNRRDVEHFWDMNPEDDVIAYCGITAVG